MFVIQCECGQTNDASAPYCVKCRRGFTAPTLRQRAEDAAYGALGLFAVGLVWLVGMNYAAEDTHQTWRSGATVNRLIYLLVGKWPPVLVWWIGAGVCLWNAWRLRRAVRHEATQSHSAPASPMSASGAPLPGNGVHLYRSLGVLIAAVAAACVLTTLVGIAPVLPPESFSKQLAYGFSALAAALVVAGVVLKTRVPHRSFTQSTAEYWSSKQVASAATLTWLTLESAVMAAGAGYVLTADPLLLLALCAAIVAFAWCNPHAYTKQ